MHDTCCSDNLVHTCWHSIKQYCYHAWYTLFEQHVHACWFIIREHCCSNRHEQLLTILFIGCNTMLFRWHAISVMKWRKDLNERQPIRFAKEYCVPSSKRCKKPTTDWTVRELKWIEPETCCAFTTKDTARILEVLTYVAKTNFDYLYIPWSFLSYLQALLVKIALSASCTEDRRNYLSVKLQHGPNNKHKFNLLQAKRTKQRNPAQLK